MFSFQHSSEHPSHSPPRSLKHWARLTTPANSAHIPPATGSGASSTGGNPTPNVPTMSTREKDRRNGAGPSQASLGNRKQPESPCLPSPHGIPGEPEPHSCQHTDRTNTLTLRTLQHPIPEGTLKVSLSPCPGAHPVRRAGQVAFNHWESQGGGVTVTTATCSQLSGIEDDPGGRGEGSGPSRP